MRPVAFLTVALIIGTIVGRAEAAPVAPAKPQQPPTQTLAEPKARPNRLAISIGFGLGSAAMSSFHDFTNDATKFYESANAGLEIGELSSNFQINGEFSFRYYFPYYVLAQVGYGAIYNWSSAPSTFRGIETSFEYHNILMEVPILAGGYYTFIDRIYVYGAVGPSVFFFSRSYWDGEHSAPTDFKASSGVGFTALGGGDFMLTNNLAFGLELRYRYLKSTEIVELKTGGKIPIGEAGESWDLDFSGISVGFFIRLFAL